MEAKARQGRGNRQAGPSLCGHPVYRVPANSPPAECTLSDTLESTEPRDGSGEILQILRKVDK